MKYRFILFMAFASVCAFAQDNLSALMPMPNHISENGKQYFAVDKTNTTIEISADSLRNEASVAKEILHERLNIELPTQIANHLSASKTKRIRLLIDHSISGTEHYILTVTSSELTIRSATRAGIFYGLMTLDQLLMGDYSHTQASKIQAITINDAPRFAYRALMIDPARNFLPAKDVKFYIDRMAHYKYNVLQIHLTDDQGWRLEIKSHPELTSATASQGRFYTQEEMKDIIAYAANHHITIIPEIDIPGHTVSLLAVHPEMGCTNTDTMPKNVGKTTNMMLCASQLPVYDLCNDIIKEVARIFPSEYIHLGGDEAAVAQNWAKCDRCQSLMKENGYTDASQLMNIFFGKIIPMVRAEGKKAMLWCELDNIRMPASKYLFDYPKDVALVTWRNGLTPLCLKLTGEAGNDIIMAPGEYTYLDYPQYKNDLPEFDNWGMPMTTLETCYQFDPGYEKPAAEQKHIKGVMGTLWGEAMKDINRVNYMTYPRALALAEAGWTNMEHRGWRSFLQRMYPNLDDMMKNGVSLRVPFEVVRK